MKPTTVFTRANQCLAAAVLLAGFAFGSTAVASAEPALDMDTYITCVKDLTANPGYNENDVLQTCCVRAGGHPRYDNDGQMINCDTPYAQQQPTDPSGKPPGAPPQVEGVQGPGVPIGPVPLVPGSRG